MTTSVREILIERLSEDLLGPKQKDEVIYDKYPSDRYLFGILFPPETPIPSEDDENIESEGENDIEDNSSSEKIAISKTFRPSSMGLSFLINAENLDNNIILELDISLATYIPIDYCKLFDDNDEPITDKKKEKIHSLWYRQDHKILENITLSKSIIRKKIDKIENLELYIKTLKGKNPNTKMVTASLLNTFVYDEKDKHDKKEIESKSFFQSNIIINCINGNFIPRENRFVSGDYDTKSSNLIYRDNKEYATGHTCSAIWNLDKENIVIRSSWMPQANVKKTNPNGDEIFISELKKNFDNKINNFYSSEFIKKNKDHVKKLLSVITSAYSKWIEKEKEKLNKLDNIFKEQGNSHIENCETALKRMEEGVNLIVSSKENLEAFSYANEAMLKQSQWTEKSNEYQLIWRPFQLGFMLLSAASLINSKHKDREILNLLWFPTGGGKTEAYLLISAFLIFLRRIQTSDSLDYLGINIFMRYTLRTLTVQQFQRAAKMILACELIRKKYQSKYTNKLGDKEISIGLWVGAKTTPNRWTEAKELIYEPEGSSPNQMQICPCCNDELKWSSNYYTKTINYLVSPKCKNDKCEIFQLENLPIYTVDDYIYDKKPTLLIGTIDKFAQITRSPNIKQMFSLNKNTSTQPPELIIQDELHLISGPLGTLAGLYEIAIDEFCSSKGIMPKIIGSTATIRRAQDQVKKLFNRDAFQFPPPAIDADNSCFSKTDKLDDGRIYLGLTTAGRSQRYVIQQACASLLQSIKDKNINKEEIDPYTTLVSYYNSLRELGGSIVLMQDDVRSSMKIFSKRHDEELRKTGSPHELKGSLSSTVVRDLLKDLDEEKYFIKDKKNGELVKNEDCIDILLSTNMLSVGVDINRLGLMVVNGQPKTMSEYIQSTSRIGRRYPGLVVSVYNNQRNRDKSHFESFSTWHGALYKDIEATSVTPFAPRAREKALHAVLVALARNLIEGLDARPRLDIKKVQSIENIILPLILKRIKIIDPDEYDKSKEELQTKINQWILRSKKTELNLYWSESKFHRKKSLMVSSEMAAERQAAGLAEVEAWSTPNSMRDVEPETQFQLIEQKDENAS